MIRTLSRSVLVILASVAFIGGVVFVNGSIPRGDRSDPDAALGRGGPGVDVDEGGEEEAQEQAEKTEQRNEAFAAAKKAGKAGQAMPAAALAAAGWVGEQPFDTLWDDWEPAIAADPNGQWVYALVTRYGAPKPCPGNCPSPYIVLEISPDNGATWSEGVPLCACKGKGQFDPIIEVVPDTGHVYALFMIGFNVVFTKSEDNGAHWSPFVPTWGNVSWNDKPVIATSDDGRDVYLSFNGPTGGDPWAVQSHDFGDTWSQVKLVNSGRYFFAFDADVDADGNVYFSESALQYANAGKSGPVIGTIEEHVFVSTNGGESWIDRLVATVSPGVACDAAGCTPDFYVGHTALTADAAGAVTLLYDGATRPGELQRIYAKRSTDFGETWSEAVTLSKAGEEATAPAIELGGPGDVRAWYYETSSGGNDDAWNIWYRRSADGGATWGDPVKISDAGGGAAYKTPQGFLEVYGDYGEMAITSDSKTIAIWGEGLSYTGPGGVWFNRER